MKKNETAVIVDVDSKTIHAPYSDTFSCRESYIVMCSEKGAKQIVYQRMMQVAFVKYTMFKSKITVAAEKGIAETSELWLAQAREGGHMVQQDSVVISDSMSSINDDISRPLLHISNLVNHTNNITNLHNTTLGATQLESRFLLDNDNSLDQLLNMTA